MRTFIDKNGEVDPSDSRLVGLDWNKTDREIPDLGDPSVRVLLDKGGIIRMPDLDAMEAFFTKRLAAYEQQNKGQ